MVGNSRVVSNEMGAFSKRRYIPIKYRGGRRAHVSGRAHVRNDRRAIPRAETWDPVPFQTIPMRTRSFRAETSGNIRDFRTKTRGCEV